MLSRNPNKRFAGGIVSLGRGFGGNFGFSRFLFFTLLVAAVYTGKLLVLKFCGTLFGLDREMAAYIFAPNHLATDGFPASSDAVVINCVKQIVNQEQERLLGRMMFVLPDDLELHVRRPIGFDIEMFIRLPGFDR